MYSDIKFVIFLESFFKIKISSKFNFSNFFFKFGLFFSFLKILRLNNKSFVLLYFSHILTATGHFANTFNNTTQNKFSFFLQINKYNWFGPWLKLFNFFIVKILMLNKNVDPHIFKLHKKYEIRKIFKFNRWIYYFNQLIFLNNRYIRINRLLFKAGNVRFNNLRYTVVHRKKYFNGYNTNNTYRNLKHNSPIHNSPSYSKHRYSNPVYYNPKYNKPSYTSPKYKNPRPNNPKYNNSKYNNPKFSNFKSSSPNCNNPKRLTHKYNNPKYITPKDDAINTTGRKADNPRLTNNPKFHNRPNGSNFKFYLKKYILKKIKAKKKLLKSKAILRKLLKKIKTTRFLNIANSNFYTRNFNEIRPFFKFIISKKPDVIIKRKGLKEFNVKTSSLLQNIKLLFSKLRYFYYKLFYLLPIFFFKALSLYLL